MKFEKVEPGTVFIQEIGGIYGTIYWFVYRKESDKFYSILFRSRSLMGSKIKKEIITKDDYNDSDLVWRELNTTKPAQKVLRNLISEML